MSDTCDRCGEPMRSYLGFECEDCMVGRLADQIARRDEPTPKPVSPPTPVPAAPPLIEAKRVRGITKFKRRFQAQLTRKGKTTYLGTFDTTEEAAEAIARFDGANQ